MSRLPEWARRGRSGWRFTGGTRPEFAIEPRAGQESVWDYPRPPIAVPDTREILIEADEHRIAHTTRAIRVLETASPPTFYLPEADVALEHLVVAPGVSRCEWKGEARYWSLSAGQTTHERIAWSYPEPFDEFAILRDHIAFYPAPLVCTVDGERVRPQPGSFYAGWVTSEIVGPFKGEPGSHGW